MFKTMDTDNHPSANSLDVWERFLSHLQPVALEPLPGKTPNKFRGRLRLAHLGDLRVSILHATEHCLRNEPPSVSSKIREEYVLILPMTGNMLIQQGRVDIPLIRDQILLVNLSYPVETIYLTPASCLQIMIPVARLRHVSKLLPDSSPRVLNSSSGLGLILRNQCMGLINGLGGVTDEKSCHTLGEMLIDMLTLVINHEVPETNRKSPEQQRLTDILSAIDQQLENPEISTDSVANAAHISRAYLFKLLKRHHTSFRQEVLNRRLDRARTLLKDPTLAHLPVSDIAWRLGFNSHSHFSRSFHKASGISPTDYRRLHPSVTTDEAHCRNLELDLS